MIQTGAPNVDNEIEFFRSTWQQIGVGIEVRHYPIANALRSRYGEGGIIHGGKWDVVLFNWVGDPIGDFSPLFACDEIPPNGQNDVHWCNPGRERRYACESSRLRSGAAQRRRSRALRTVSTKTFRKIVLYTVAEVYVYNRDLKDFHPTSVTPIRQYDECRYLVILVTYISLSVR